MASGGGNHYAYSIQLIAYCNYFTLKRDEADDGKQIIWDKMDNVCKFHVLYSLSLRSEYQVCHFPISHLFSPLYLSRLGLWSMAEYGIRMEILQSP